MCIASIVSNHPLCGESQCSLQNQPAGPLTQILLRELLFQEQHRKNNSTEATISTEEMHYCSDEKNGVHMFSLTKNSRLFDKMKRATESNLAIKEVESGDEPGDEKIDVYTWLQHPEDRLVSDGDVYCRLDAKLVWDDTTQGLRWKQPLCQTQHNRKAYERMNFLIKQAFLDEYKTNLIAQCTE